MKTTATLILALAILITILAVVSGFGVRMEWWGFPLGFKLLKAASMSGIFVGGGALVVLLAGVKRKAPLQRKAVVALIVSGLVVAIPFITEKEFRKIPTFVDATTNLENPPSFVDLADERKAASEFLMDFSVEEAQAAQQKYFPDLGPVSIKLPASEAAEKTRKVLSEMGLSIASSADSSDRVEATETSFWFGFKDDVVVVFETQPDGLTRIDVRSASRVGKMDGGTNAQRVQAILAALQ